MGGKKIVLPQDFIDFCLKSEGGYSFEELRMKLFNEYNIEITRGALRVKLYKCGYKLNYEVVKNIKNKYHRACFEFFKKKEALTKLKREEFLKTCTQNEIQNLQIKRKLKYDGC